MLQNWSCIKIGEHVDDIMWNNCDILAGGKTIFNLRLFKFGLWYLSICFVIRFRYLMIPGLIDVLKQIL